MTEVNAAAQTQQAQSQSKLATAGLADNFDTFLTLLTEQLKNQDPLDPLESEQFVQQLVQFSSVEQQIASNESLEALLALQQSDAQLKALDFIGKEATVNTRSSRTRRTARRTDSPPGTGSPWRSRPTCPPPPLLTRSTASP